MSKYDNKLLQDGVYRYKEEIERLYDIQPGDNLIDSEAQNRAHHQLAINADCLYDGWKNFIEQVCGASDVQSAKFASHYYLADEISIREAISRLDSALHWIFQPSGGGSGGGGGGGGGGLPPSSDIAIKIKSVSSILSLPTSKEIYSSSFSVSSRVVCVDPVSPNRIIYSPAILAINMINESIKLYFSPSGFNSSDIDLFSPTWYGLYFVGDSPHYFNEKVILEQIPVLSPYFLYIYDSKKGQYAYTSLSGGTSERCHDLCIGAWLSFSGFRMGMVYIDEDFIQFREYHPSRYYTLPPGVITYVDFWKYHPKPSELKKNDPTYNIVVDGWYSSPEASPISFPFEDKILWWTEGTNTDYQHFNTPITEWKKQINITTTEDVRILSSYLHKVRGVETTYSAMYWSVWDEDSGYLYLPRRLSCIDDPAVIRNRQPDNIPTDHNVFHLYYDSAPDKQYVKYRIPVAGDSNCMVDAFLPLTSDYNHTGIFFSLNYLSEGTISNKLFFLWWNQEIGEYRYSILQDPYTDHTTHSNEDDYFYGVGGAWSSPKSFTEENFVVDSGGTSKFSIHGDETVTQGMLFGFPGSLVTIDGRVVIAYIFALNVDSIPVGSTGFYLRVIGGVWKQNKYKWTYDTYTLPKRCSSKFSQAHDYTTKHRYLPKIELIQDPETFAVYAFYLDEYDNTIWKIKLDWEIV